MKLTDKIWFWKILLAVIKLVAGTTVISQITIGQSIYRNRGADEQASPAALHCASDAGRQKRYTCPVTILIFIAQTDVIRVD